MAETETWIHPVTIGSEPASRALAVWRFRLILLVLILALGVVAFLAVKAFRGGENAQAHGRLVVATSAVSEHL